MPSPEVDVYDRAASQVIEQARQDLGMPKTTLAIRSDVNYESLKGYLAGKRAMSVGTFRALAVALRLTHEEAAQRLGAILAAGEKSDE